MKIFGGGGSKGTRSKSKPQKKAKVKKPRSAAKKVLLAFLVILVLIIAAGGIWLAFNVKPPSISTHKNNTTVIDTENGDIPAIDLNMGDRIDDFFTFVVCATDIDETRTDNIMVVAFDTKKHTVNVMNVPRDTMSNISKTGANRKINAAYARGVEQTKKQVKQVMGFTPDKFIVVNFNGIEEIVNAIGGVDYEIPFPMMYSDPTQKLEINFPTAGMRHLDGAEVVDFLRWRKNGRGYTQYVPKEYLNGDETRIQKQQEFLKHLAGELLTLKNAVNAKKIANAVFDNVKTDITAGEMLWLSGQTFQVDKSNINMFTLPGYSSSSTAGNNTELSFYFINERPALKLINEYFNPYDKKITSLDLVAGPTKGTGVTKRSEEGKRTTTPEDEDEEDDEPRENTSNKPNHNGDDEEKNTNENSGNSSGSGKPNNSSGNNSGNSGGGSDNSNGSGGSNNAGENSGNTGGSENSGGNSESGGQSNNSGSSGGSTGESGGSSNETPVPSAPSTPPTDPEA